MKFSEMFTTEVPSTTPFTSLPLDVCNFLRNTMFYEDTFNPRFYSDYEDEITRGVPCFRRDDIPVQEYLSVLRVFICEQGVYFEIQNDYRSLEYSRFDRMFDILRTAYSIDALEDNEEYHQLLTVGILDDYLGSKLEDLKERGYLE